MVHRHRAADGMSSVLKSLTILVSVAVLFALALSLLWQVPYVFTFVGLAALVVIGHLVTIDDDMPDGWSNEDGSQPFPWGELLLKLAVLVALGLVAFLFPTIRALGGE